MAEFLARPAHPITATGDNILLTFDDEVAGRHYLALYLGASTVTTPTYDYHLCGSAFYSHPVQTEHSGNANLNLTKVADEDYDLTITKPFTVQGLGFMTIAGSINTAGALPGGRGYKFIVKLRHYDGTTETDIATAESVFRDNGTYGIRECLPLSITTASNLGVGDTLRITVEFWTIHSNGDGYVMAFGHDPQNRDGLNCYPSTFTFKSSAGTIAKAWIPIVLPE